jgi:type II secretory pathway component PulF
MPEHAPDSAPSLSADQAEAVLGRAALIAAGGMPLAAGLRVAAGECDSRGLARRLRSMADDLDRGRSLQDCLAAATRRLPPHLSGLIQAAQRTGAVGPMLIEWLENRRTARQQWRAIVAALSYPLIAILMAVGVYVLFATLVVRPFEHMYEEFGLRLPTITVSFLRMCRFAVPLVAFFGGAIVATCVATRVLGGRIGWSWLITNLPLVGSAWHWTGVAEMLRCLALLVEHRVPLPEALRLTAGGVLDAYVGEQCRTLAGQVEQGTSLTMSLVQLRTLPLSIVPLIRCGESQDALADSLRSAAEMIARRLDMRAGLLVQVLPPILLVTVGFAVASGAVSLFLPLISLIQGLS